MHLRQSLSRLLLVLVAGLALASAARAASWSADFDLSDERKTDISGGAGEPIKRDITETVKQAYSVTYEVEVDPNLSFSLDLSLDITHDIQDGTETGDQDSYEIKPEVGFDVKAAWWDLTANWSDTVKSTQDDETSPTDDLSWDVELGMQPESDAMPELTLKYKRDVKEEARERQTVDDSWEGSLDYTFWEFLDVSLDAQRSYSDDLANDPDQDKLDRKFGIDVSADHEIGENFKVEGKWTNERNQSKTFEAGDLEEPYTDTLKNTIEGKATYTPLESVEGSVDRKVEWTADMFNPRDDDVEVTDTLTTELSYDQSFTETIDFSGSYSDERKATRGKYDSNGHEINKDLSLSTDFNPLESVTFSVSYDRTDDLKWLDHPTSADDAQDHKIDNKWEVKLDTAVWDDNVKFTVTRSLNDTTEDGDETTRQNKWDVDFEIAFDTVPNLEFTPTLTYTKDDDLIKDTTEEEKKVEVGIKYEVSLGDVLTFSLDHTYTRTSKYPAEGAATIKRDDSTDLTLSWTDFFEGMKAEIDWTRKASDESKDNKGPVIDYTYKFTYDWDILENYTFSFEYSYDKKQDSQDNQIFKTSFSADFLDGLVTLSLEHEYDEQIKDDDGDETKDTHRYLIELQGKF